MEAPNSVDFSALSRVSEPEPAPPGSQSKRVVFGDRVEVWYFDRCPQYDRTPRDTPKLPLGMGHRCVHHEFEPLCKDLKDTRYKLRRIRYERRRILLLAASSSRRQRLLRSRCARPLAEDGSTWELKPHSPEVSPSIAPPQQDSDSWEEVSLSEDVLELMAKCKTLQLVPDGSPQGEDADQTSCLDGQVGVSIAAGLLGEEVVSRHDPASLAPVVVSVDCDGEEE